MYANARVPDRKYLWTVVSLFTLLGLLGLGVLFYKPLRARYAIYKVQHTTWEDIDRGRVAAEDYVRWANDCLFAACRGNRLAMETVIDAYNFGDESIGATTSSLPYKAAAGQPVAFFEVLGNRPPDQILEILMGILMHINGDFDMELRPGDYRLDGSPRGVVRELGRHLNAKDPEVRRVATAALDFVRCRFTKELAEAEKGQK
jgi:hypothetical protein